MRRITLEQLLVAGLCIAFICALIAYYALVWLGFSEGWLQLFGRPSRATTLWETTMFVVSTVIFVLVFLAVFRRFKRFLRPGGQNL